MPDAWSCTATSSAGLSTLELDKNTVNSCASNSVGMAVKKNCLTEKTVFFKGNDKANLAYMYALLNIRWQSRLFLNIFIDVLFITVSGNLFQSLTTLWLKKFFLTLSLTLWTPEDGIPTFRKCPNATKLRYTVQTASYKPRRPTVYHRYGS